MDVNIEFLNSIYQNTEIIFMANELLGFGQNNIEEYKKYLE